MQIVGVEPQKNVHRRSIFAYFLDSNTFEMLENVCTCQEHAFRSAYTQRQTHVPRVEGAPLIKSGHLSILIYCTE